MRVRSLPKVEGVIRYTLSEDEALFTVFAGSYLGPILGWFCFALIVSDPRISMKKNKKRKRGTRYNRFGFRPPNSLPLRFWMDLS